MKIFRTFIILAATAALMAAANADVKVTQTMNIDSPQIKAAMQSMSPEQRAQMAKAGIGNAVSLTVYVSGKKSRIDFGKFTSAIIDEAKGTATELNRTAHTYSTKSIKNAATRAGNTKGTIKATGKSKKLLGHVCHEYTISAGNPAGPGSAVTGDMWVASDLPRPSSLAMATGPAAMLQSQWNKIPGMPLQMDITIIGGPMGKTIVHSITKSVSKSPLPASIFAIPAGYKAGPTYFAPMAGGPGH